MKLFTRSILAAVALSVMAVPMAQAQSRYDAPRHGHRYEQPEKNRYHAPKKAQAPRHVQKRHHWSKGARVPEWQRKPVVRDYKRHGLRKPGKGQQWIKVDNDYLLIGLAGGVIASIVAAR